MLSSRPTKLDSAVVASFELLVPRYPGDVFHFSNYYELLCSSSPPTPENSEVHAQVVVNSYIKVSLFFPFLFHFLPLFLCRNLLFLFPSCRFFCSFFLSLVALSPNLLYTANVVKSFCLGGSSATYASHVIYGDINGPICCWTGSCGSVVHV